MRLFDKFFLIHSSSSIHKKCQEIDRVLRKIVENVKITQGKANFHRWKAYSLPSMKIIIYEMYIRRTKIAISTFETY